MQKANIKISSELARFENLKTRVDDVIAQRQEEEEDMDDIPDELMGWSHEAELTANVASSSGLLNRSCPCRSAHADAHEGSGSSANFRHDHGSTNHLAPSAQHSKRPVQPLASHGERPGAW